MTKSKEVIRASLVNHTTADCSDVSVKDCHYHYHLTFDESVGWEWVEKQVEACGEKQDILLDMWKIRPSGMHSFEIEVREIPRRADVSEDDSQQGISDF